MGELGAVHFGLSQSFQDELVREVMERTASARQPGQGPSIEVRRTLSVPGRRRRPRNMPSPVDTSLLLVSPRPISRDSSNASVDDQLIFRLCDQFTCDLVSPGVHYRVVSGLHLQWYRRLPSIPED
mmetsp:Transcript_2977/g.5693  ORF Transcript_2977/g.5693 Transcript_2977/m.5693 type:complete len:126 (+) Transcript_2977:1546-1923(+)